MNGIEVGGWRLQGILNRLKSLICVGATLRMRRVGGRDFAVAICLTVLV